MREIHADTIRETVARLCQEASCLLPDDVVGALQTAREREQSFEQDGPPSSIVITVTTADG